MDTWIESIDPQIVLLIAAIAIAFLLVKLLFRVLKASFGLIVAILAIVLVLQAFFGISPNQVWVEIGNLPQEVVQRVQGFDFNALTTLFSGIFAD